MMKNAIRLGDWDFAKDSAGSVYIYHWCSFSDAVDDLKERSPISSARMNWNGEETRIVCRGCHVQAPLEVNGFFNLLDWNYV